MKIVITDYHIAQRILKARMDAHAVLSTPMAPWCDEWEKYAYASWFLEDWRNARLAEWNAVRQGVPFK
jgi:hypothetical protein